MKWLIYMLILVNLGIFVWHYQGDGRKAATDVDVQTTRLVLLREYRARQEKIASGGQGKTSQSTCYSLGPFTNKTVAEKALQILQKDKIKAWNRVDSNSVRAGFWVFLPPAESNKKLEHTLQKLKRSKEKDYFPVATGGMKNAVSLGVFSKAKLARSRMQEINKQGFDAKIKKVTLPKRVYWLDWKKDVAKQPSEQLLESLRGQFSGIGQTERSCDSEMTSG